MTDAVRQTAFTLLAFNELIQYLSVALGVIGCGFSVYAFADAAGAHRLLMLEHINGLRLGLVKLHLVTHGGILVVQVLLILISLMAATMPDVPMEMYLHDAAGPWVVVVIVTRKLLRMGMVLVLLAVSVYKVRWLRWLAGVEG